MLGGKSLLRKVLLLEWIGSCGISRKLSSQAGVLLTSDACTCGRALLACLCRELVEIPHQVESPALLANAKERLRNEHSAQFTFSENCPFFAFYRSS